MKQVLIIALIGLTLSGCMGKDVREAKPTATATAQLVVATLEPTATAITISTNTPKPTLTKTPLPSSPSMALTSTPIEIATSNYYDLPAWIADPNANILAIDTMDDWHNENYAVSFFNAETGERYDIPYESYIRPFWQQREDGLYLQVRYVPDENNREEINITTGKITRLAVKNQEYTGILDIPSPDGKYLGQITKDEDDKFKAILINQETQESFELFHPNENGKLIKSAWSPDSQMLAIWAVDPTTESLDNDFVTVYATDGEVIGNFNYVNSVNWSPEQPYRILFSEYNDYETSPPCILDVLSDTRTCFDKVSHWRQEQDAGITRYQWSPDGQKISFISWNMGEAYGGGLCVYELNSENISCPVMSSDLQLEGFDYLFVRDYFWSPDGKNIAFYINPNPPPSDDGGLQSIAVVDREGGNLIIIGPSYGFWNPWRPQ